MSETMVAGGRGLGLERLIRRGLKSDSDNDSTLPPQGVEPTSLSALTRNQRMATALLGAGGLIGGLVLTKGQTGGIRAAAAGAGLVLGSALAAFPATRYNGAERSYVVTFDTAPDYNAVQGDPAGVQRVAQEHFDLKSPPVQATIDLLEGAGVVARATAHPFNNGYVVTVPRVWADKFEHRMERTDNVGTVEPAEL